MSLLFRNAGLQGFNDLATVNPAIAKEWDYEKNDELSPEKLLPEAVKSMVEM